MQVMARQIVAFFDTDVLVLPTYMHSPIRVGEWADLTPKRPGKDYSLGCSCPPLMPADSQRSLPTGFDSNGLPIGVQLVGRPAAEATPLP